MAEKQEQQVKVKTIHGIKHDSGDVIAPGTVVKAPKSVADLWISMGAAALHVEEPAAAKQPAPETDEEKAVRLAAEEEAALLTGKSAK